MVPVHLDHDTGLNSETLQRKKALAKATVSPAILLDPRRISVAEGIYKIRLEDEKHVDHLQESIHDNPSNTQALTMVVLSMFFV